ncbi:c-type cytochrome [Microbaculum sp. FT89]|uniref:c-type cytochrome n=1 Tax=Microbaculum sp. FT89 TaxID=3447298 RepID=UPI003F52AC62
MKTIRILISAGVIAWFVSPAEAETPLERGTYLMNGPAACANCHSPINADGTPVPGKELSGRLVDDNEAFTAYGSNLTPDEETGIGAWTDEQIITAIREGKRPDGTIIGPPMPIGLYRGISDADARAIVAYLRALPPVKNAVPKSTYRISLPPSYGPPVGEVASPEPGATAEYGAYLAGPVAHCMECHTPMGPQGPDFANRLGAGGFEFHGPWGVSVTSNLTPHEDGIAGYSDEDLVAMITTGTRPDGTRMLPPMGYGYYANIKQDDLKAIIAYLRTLPAQPDPQ